MRQLPAKAVLVQVCFAARLAVAVAVAVAVAAAVVLNSSQTENPAS